MSIVIDADKLWKAITTDHDEYIELGELGELIYDGEMEASIAQKTGHWIAVDSFSAFGGDEEVWMAHGNPTAYHYCSECKCMATVNEEGAELLTKYCWNCGARMLKGEEDEL